MQRYVAETVTNNEFSTVTIGESVLHHESLELTQRVRLSEPEIILASYLITHPDVPHISETIKTGTNGKIGKISTIFDSLLDSCREQSKLVGSHFMQLGRSRSKTYGFIINNSDQARIEYANLAILDIGMTKKIGERRIKKRQQPFYDLIDLIENGPSESRFTRNRKIAGGVSAIGIGIGIAATYYSLNKSK